MAAEASACTGCRRTFSPIIVGSVDQLSASGSFWPTKTTVRPEPTCVAVTVTALRSPASRCCWMRAKGTASVMSCSMAAGSTSPTPCVAVGRDRRRAADDGAHEGEQLAAVDREHAVDGEVRPDVDEAARAGARIVGEGGEAAGVERTDGGAAQDVERWIAAEVAGDVLEDVLHDADFVGAARGAAGEHERHLAATVRSARALRSRRHSSSLHCASATRQQASARRSARGARRRP